MYCTECGCQNPDDARFCAGCGKQMVGQPASNTSPPDSHVGKTCPFCQTPIKPGANVITCPACGMPHHEDCWQENGGCTTFGCTSAHGVSVSAQHSERLENGQLPDDTIDLTVESELQSVTAVAASTSHRRRQSGWRFWSLAALLFALLGGGSFIGWHVWTRLKLGDMHINSVDGAQMVWVPEGTFTMGNPPYVDEGDDPPPIAHQVTLSGYWIYKYEVTVAQYRAFCTATGHAIPQWPGALYSRAGKSGWDDPALQQHPIVNVTWYDAKAYADWAGVALPAEAQWEYAARGPQENNYPWGGTATTADPDDGWDQTKCANYLNSYSPWPVGSFPADTSWCGAMDMAGSVSEWCADWYGPYTSMPVTNPTGPTTGNVRVMRGGSWNDGTEYGTFYRSAFVNTDSPDDDWDFLGFRCASISPGP